MNLKKLGVIALSAVTMMAPCATTVFAEDPTTTITYTEAESYTWNIPSSAVSINTDNSYTLGVNDVKLPSGKKLQVTATGSGTDGAFTMAKGDDTMPYTVKVGNSDEAIKPGAVVLVCKPSQTENSVTLNVAVAKDASVSYAAGTYTGTITYAASLVDMGD